ncbi:ATP12-domain-containing protein [Linderina pennispora]|uniref:ATP12-domain-containing protein n=1 Tax=Linderina pennispora TaxID=61395 RepID=A0A1Y1VZP6_9FUNG|nr:ATP12-domain-containing protein [Linderina pennispora]ORX66486.1 ATP12-domain-containing protein [Linderina pennispora]
MVVQYIRKTQTKSGQPEPDHFGDVMSQRETSCMLPAIFKNPVQRIMLMANGNLQRVLSAYYNLPVSVEEQRTLPIRYCRTINLVDLLTKKAADLVVNQGVGIGQLFRYMNAHLSEYDGSFSRLYDLCSEDVACKDPRGLPRWRAVAGLLPAAKPGETAAETLAKNKAPRIKRFWRTVGLDGRPIKTPDGTSVRLPPTHDILAALVAGEWESQREFLGAHALPLTSLVCRSIDGLSDANVRGEVVLKLLKYLHTDSACLHEEFPQALVELQEKHYRPIIDWAAKHYGIGINVTANLFTLRQEKHAEELAAFEKAVMTGKVVPDRAGAG